MTAPTLVPVMAHLLVGSPVGPLRLTSDGSALVGLHFVESAAAGPPAAEPAAEPPAASPDRVLRAARAQLDEFFAGERLAFDLPLRTAGTAFQQRVWQFLSMIRYGGTTSYGQLAAALGDVRATRAVGLANGRNPVSIIVPCHRVIGTDGSLTGYGGGLDRKRWLLAHEARVLAERGESDRLF